MLFPPLEAEGRGGSTTLAASSVGANAAAGGSASGTTKKSSCPGSAGASGKSKFSNVGSEHGVPSKFTRELLDQFWYRK